MVLAGIHDTAATLSGYDALSLDGSEADSLAKATVNLLEQFDYKPNPKVEAAMALAGVSAAIYGPRIMIIKMELAEKRAAKTPPVVFEPPSLKKKNGKAPENSTGILTLAEIEGLNNG